jgi:A/G-specific adenine glycosylase
VKRGGKTSAEIPPHDDSWKNSQWRSRVRRRLLDWFFKHAREMPWRADPTPYRVWVSEIMLQQTQVATVIPYFQRFLIAFPTIDDLAQADPQRLMSHWEGLGYYRRAKSLQAAAQVIAADHNGVFPETFDEVIALPGIGRYTAGAILSISRGARLPVLEGNTQRVFSRWAAIRGSTTDAATTRLLWEIAAAMLPRRGAGDFNQAAMELGALICTPKSPKCEFCPVRSRCRAHADGLQEEIPGKVTRIQYERRTEFALVIQESSKRTSNFLVRPLPEGGRWAGLWDFPRTTRESLDSVDCAAAELADQLGVPISAGLRLETFKHAVTKYRISLHVHEASLVRSLQSKGPWRFVSLDEMSKLPMSVTGRQIADLLRSDRQEKLPL